MREEMKSLIPYALTRLQQNKLMGLKIQVNNYFFDVSEIILQLKLTPSLNGLSEKRMYHYVNTELVDSQFNLSVHHVHYLTGSRFPDRNKDIYIVALSIVILLTALQQTKTFLKEHITNYFRPEF